MNICFITKYPPIEGGVSSQNYWLARGLGEKGHKIFVVTNAYEVSKEYRCKLTADDINEYQPKGVIVYNTTPFVQTTFIPYANPFVTKLASIAVKVIKDFDVDLIFAHYFEPYCVAGFLAKLLTSKPLVIKHAGSDISRLFNDANLHHFYSELLDNVDLIISPKSTAERIKLLGHKTTIDSSTKYALNEKFFNENIQSIDWNDYIPNYANQPVILMYGKAGETKGSFDIFHILKHLKNKFLFVYITSPGSSEKLEYLTTKLNIDEKVHFLNFVSNIEIAKIIKSSSIACFLERNFPIPIHGPIIPREIMSVGTCLVVSEEIFNKQYYKEKLKNMENVVVVNPIKHYETAVVIDKLLEDKERMIKIGKEGNRVFKEINDYNEFISSYENIFLRISQQSGVLSNIKGRNMNWGDLKTNLEISLPDSEQYEWLFDDIPDRIKPFEGNYWYGVRGFFQDGEPRLYPITVVKTGVIFEIYIDSASYDYDDIVKSIDIAQKNTSLRFKDK